MAAEPVPEPDLDTLARHVIPAKIDAAGYAISLLHADVRALRADTSARFDRVDEALAEILRRLPPQA